MGIITEHFHSKRLKAFNINIKTKYQDGANVKERNTNNSYNDDIKGGIVLNKTYFKDDKQIHIEKEFNPSLLYTFMINSKLEDEITCSNCGMTGKGKDFINGCPYCRTIYTVDYSEKNVAGKENYNYVMKDNKYKKRAFKKGFIICLILSSLYCISTGRTFTIFDILKILIFTSISSLILFYAFYMVDLHQITQRVKEEKELQNQKQKKFWSEIEKLNIKKEKFFNNLNSELNEYFYDGLIDENKNVIDYDVIDYEDYEYFFDENNKINIKVKLAIRVIELKNDLIESSKKEMSFVLVQNEIIQQENGIYLAKCHKCGASIDIMKEECEYCRSKIHYLQSWYISKSEIL